MRRLAVLSFLLLLSHAAELPAEPAGLRLAVIVHPDRIAQLSREDVVQIYLEKRRFWGDGKPIVALNREAGSAERDRFSRSVLKRNDAELETYWNQRYFEGVFPPATLSSDIAVRRYVAADRDAIGYIKLENVDSSVRVALRLD